MGAIYDKLQAIAKLSLWFDILTVCINDVGPEIRDTDHSRYISLFHKPAACAADLTITAERRAP
jgi:hypothetical protein